ncbi:MAG: CBS domain-containing protein [Pseudomonadota bacterium]|nr:CBS domain-containing protein [Roseovarius sp. EGI FJ00037]MCZ0813481.1 CBS domain-containing protein [Roseovarius sp. EGI FJ00037]
MQISELMTRDPITVTPNQTICEPAAIMEKSGLGFLPVG